MTFVDFPDAVRKANLWELGRGGGKDKLLVRRIPYSGTTDMEELLLGMKVLGLIDRKDWIGVESGGKVSIIDVETDIERYFLTFEH